MKKYLILLTLVFMQLSIFSQDDRKLYFELVKKVNSVSSYSCDLIYESYNDLRNSEYSSRTVGHYSLNAGSYKLELDDMVILRDNSVLVTVNNKAKNIYLGIDSSAVNLSMSEEMVQSFASLAEISKIKESDEGIIFRFDLSKLNGSPIEYLDIEISKTTYFYKQIDIVYIPYEKTTNIEGSENESWSPKLKVQYENYNANPTFSNDYFLVSNFVRMEDMSLVGKFSGYQLINQIY